MNISTLISEAAKRHPQKKSVVFSRKSAQGYDYPFYTFEEFEKRSNQFAHSLLDKGIQPGDRVLLFVKPCLDFSVLTFALFKMGALPVLIDPGMGLKSLLRSVKQVRPRGLVGVPEAHWLKIFKSSSFSSVKVSLSLGSSIWAKNILEDLDQYSNEFHALEVSDSDKAAILFTSGGTGIPKGVIYTHGIFRFQTKALQEMFNLDSSDIDLPGFPLFALFTLGMGMTSVIPDMNPARPASVDPKKIVKNILDNGVSFVAGSPAIWEKVGEYCLHHRISLPSVKRVVMFGAPVRIEIHEMFQQILTSGDTYTPYGATECLPVSLISGRAILKKFKGRSLAGEGICIGLPAPETEIIIMDASDIPKTQISSLPRGHRGEIVVCGPQVTPSYFEMNSETELAKIHDQSGLWHRMGDVGYLDEEGYLWFLGRKGHVVSLPEKKIFPISVESFFNQIPWVKKSALIRYSDGAAIVLEPRKNGVTEFSLPEQLPEEIKAIFITSKLPVDVRHNIKIDRALLSKLAESKSRKLRKVFSRT